MSGYFDFVIHVRERRADSAGSAGGHYPVVAQLANGFVSDSGRLELDRVGLSLSALEQDAEAHGRKLSQALFCGPINDAFHVARGHVQNPESGYDGLRVRISIAPEAPELHALAWERLYHQAEREWGPLATSASSPFSRYVEMKSPHPLPATSGAVRILVVIAHPSGVPAEVLAPIDVSAEIENLRAAFAELPAGREVQLTFMPGRSGLTAEQRQALAQAGHTIVDGPASLDSIAARLRSGYDVLHFLGHGHFDRASGTATLHLENESGGWAPTTDVMITNAVRSLRRKPRLIFLAACESATRAEHDAFLGLAPRLVGAQVPAVVAMQDQVSMEHARTLTRHFYASLFDHGLVDLALNQARSHLHDPERLDWGTPVLFTRLTDGRLFADPNERPRNGRFLRGAIPPRVAGWVARALVATALLMPFAYWLGARAQRARELLIGIPEGDAFSYSAGKLLLTGLRALPELALYMLIGPFVGLGIERWAVPILVAMAGAAWWLHRRGRVRVLVVGLAVLLPVLAYGAVFHAHAARVHHVAMVESMPPELVRTLPEQIHIEVSSWLRNPTNVNEGRREALAGLGAWYAAVLAMLAWLAVGAARHFRSYRRWRLPALGLAALHGLVFVYVLVQVPRVYAGARWGLRYPKITAIRTECDAPDALRMAVRRGTCQAVDVTGGADGEAFIVWGSECEGAESLPESPAPGMGSESVRLVRVSLRPGARDDWRCVYQTHGKQTILNRSDS
jgi:CHAT domain